MLFLFQELEPQKTFLAFDLMHLVHDVIHDVNRTYTACDLKRCHHNTSLNMKKNHTLPDIEQSIIQNKLRIAITGICNF
jgi:hypothetical protein